jgi:hypothetical protein
MSAMVLSMALVAVPFASATPSDRTPARSVGHHPHHEAPFSSPDALGLSLLLKIQSLKLVPVEAAPAHAYATTAAPASDPVPSTTEPPRVGSATAWGCGAALQYLEAYAAPGFEFQCPGYAEGHQAMTCVDVTGVCSGEKLIAISDPCPAAYMNEAHNSWVLSNQTFGTPLPAHTSDDIDPYGYC